MKSIHKGMVALLLLVAVVLMTSSTAVAAKKMTYEEYLNELGVYQDREAKALAAIDAEKREIDRLRAEIDKIDAKIKAIWDEIYALLNTSETGIEDVMKALAAIEKHLNELSAISPDQLMKRVSELDDIDAKLKLQKEAITYKMTKVRKKTDELDARSKALRASIPKPKHDIYTVLRGDYLWKISGKKPIYGDPWKWMRIYSSNRDQIKNPDLIYPNQSLRIPRQIGQGEHLVLRGEYLSKIAARAEVYNDPFKWTKIYQANKSDGFIKDPNLIYPEQILQIPRD